MWPEERHARLSLHLSKVEQADVSRNMVSTAPKFILMAPQELNNLDLSVTHDSSGHISTVPKCFIKVHF